MFQDFPRLHLYEFVHLNLKRLNVPQLCQGLDIFFDKPKIHNINHQLNWEASLHASWLIRILQEILNQRDSNNWRMHHLQLQLGLHPCHLHELPVQLIRIWPQLHFGRSQVLFLQLVGLKVRL